MKKVVIAMLFTVTAYAQFSSKITGEALARMNGNPAFSAAEKFAIGASIIDQWGVTDLGDYGFSARSHIKQFAFYGAYHYTGSSNLMSTQGAVLGCSTPLCNFGKALPYIGLRANFSHTNLGDDFNPITNFTLDLGSMIEFAKVARADFFMNNIIASCNNSFESNYLLHTQILINAADVAWVGARLENRENFGGELFLLSNCEFLTNFSAELVVGGNPIRASLGTKYVFPRVGIFVGCTFHPELGQNYCAAIDFTRR